MTDRPHPPRRRPPSYLADYLEDMVQDLNDAIAAPAGDRPLTDRDHLIRFQRELIDKGKLIEGGWVGLRPPPSRRKAGARQLEEMRMAFFAGAQHLFGSIISSLEDGDDATPNDLRRMDLIDQELKIFIAEPERAWPLPGAPNERLSTMDLHAVRNPPRVANPEAGHLSFRRLRLVWRDHERHRAPRFRISVTPEKGPHTMNDDTLDMATLARFAILPGADIGCSAFSEILLRPAPRQCDSARASYRRDLHRRPAQHRMPDPIGAITPRQPARLAITRTGRAARWRPRHRGRENADGGLHHSGNPRRDTGHHKAVGLSGVLQRPQAGIVLPERRTGRYLGLPSSDRGTPTPARRSWPGPCRNRARRQRARDHHPGLPRPQESRPAGHGRPQLRDDFGRDRRDQRQGCFIVVEQRSLRRV